jgi:hypothetical protein
MEKITIAQTAGNVQLANAINQLIDELQGINVGNIYLVLTSTEPLYTELYKKYNKQYADGSWMIQPTILAANACTVTNRNDVVIFSANGTSNKVASMLTVSNNRVHFYGLDPNGRKIGSRCLLSNSGAGAATDTSMVKITVTGCSFHNISFKNNWTHANNLSAVCDWGIQTYFENCDIENLGSAHLTNENAASLILGGNECIYKNTTIGQDTLLITSTGGQQILIQNRGTSATKATRSRFENCRIQSYTSDTTHVFVRAGANSIDRDIAFKDCEFVNALSPTSAVTLAVAMATHASVGGSINVSFPQIFGASNLATAAVGNTGVYVVSPVLAAAASDCVGVQAS